MNFEKLTEYLDSLEEKYGIPANDCKVTKEHEVIYRKVTGHADYKKKVRDLLNFSPEITYEYAMDLSPIYDLFHKNYRGRLTDLLSDSLFDLPPEQTAELPNILLMETAAHSLLGTHDFKHFSSIRKKKGTEKEIKTITFVTEESTLYIRMTANDFLYQMAPFILGTLLDIGIGKRPVECINAILEGKEKPSASCDTKGLILYDIVY